MPRMPTRTAPVTREPNFPAEAAQLVATFSTMADGHDALHVLEAAANILIMAIVHNGKLKGLNLAATEALARRTCKSVVNDIAVQWNREPKPTDVPVEPQ